MDAKTSKGFTLESVKKTPNSAIDTASAKAEMVTVSPAPRQLPPKTAIQSGQPVVEPITPSTSQFIDSSHTSVCPWDWPAGMTVFPELSLIGPS